MPPAAGILAYLDEACVVPKGDVSTFQKSLLDAFSSHKHWSTPKQLGTSFTIAHYAGNVTYNADLFLIKNKVGVKRSCLTPSSA